MDAPTCKEVTLSRSITSKNDIVSWRKWLEVDLVAVWAEIRVRLTSELGWTVTTSHTRFEALYSERLYMHRGYEWPARPRVAGFKLIWCLFCACTSSRARVRMRTSPEEIEKQLATALETSGSLNGIADLLALASPVTKPPELQHKAIYALYRTYTLLLTTTKRLDDLRSDPSPPAQAVRQWLLQKLEQFLSLLTQQQLYNPEPSISVSSTILSSQYSYPLSSPPLSKFYSPYFVSALPHSPAVMATRKSTQYTLRPLFAVYSARPPPLLSVIRPEMNSSTNSSSPMMISGGSSFARSSMQIQFP